MLYVRTCVLCDEKIKSQHKLCKRHFIDYGDQINTPWFIELASQQKKQDDIDRRERFQLPFYSETNLQGEYNAPELLSKRDVGRPSTDWRIVDKVLKIYDASLEQVELGTAIRVKPLRQIAREIQTTMGVHIGYVTIRNILLEYRKHIYMRKEGVN